MAYTGTMESAAENLVCGETGLIVWDAELGLLRAVVLGDSRCIAQCRTVDEAQAALDQWRKAISEAANPRSV